jgi:hypothetical protein
MVAPGIEDARGGSWPALEDIDELVDLISFMPGRSVVHV